MVSEQVAPALLTVTRHGVTWLRDGGTVYPITRCCGRAVGWSGQCAGCYRMMPEGYGLAAMVGSRYFLRDLRQMVEDLTDCEDPGACRDALAVAFATP